MPGPRDLGLQIEEQGQTTIVRFPKGKALDEQASQVVGDQLSDLVAGMGRRHLVLDFGNVVYLASGALARLIGLHKTLREMGGTLTIRNVEPRIYEIFEVTKVINLFDVQRSDEDSTPFTP